MKYAHAPPSKVPPLWSFVDTQNTNSAGALPEVQQPVLEQTEKKCYKCSTPLTLSNITLYRVTHHNYLCRKCQGTYAKEWRRKNLERPVTKWFLNYDGSLITDGFLLYIGTLISNGFLP